MLQLQVEPELGDIAGFRMRGQFHELERRSWILWASLRRNLLGAPPPIRLEPFLDSALRKVDPASNLHGRPYNLRQYGFNPLIPDRYRYHDRSRDLDDATQVSSGILTRSGIGKEDF